MADVGAGAGGLIALGWAGRKVLGPTLDKIGADLAQRYEAWRMENATRIAETAARKIQPGKEEGFVAPRVAMRVLDDGSWSDAPVMAEYFGGILAAARSDDGRDDRGASWAGLVSRLATYDVYLHYLAYEALRRLYLGRTEDAFNLGDASIREGARVYLPAGQLLIALGREPTADHWSVVAQSVSALNREDLVGDQYWYGDQEFVKKVIPNAPDAGVIFTPSMPGIELFLWAHGHSDDGLQAIVDPDLVLEPVADLGHVVGANTWEAMHKAHADAEKARLARETDTGL